jgi:hypothetical protein
MLPDSSQGAHYYHFDIRPFQAMDESFLARLAPRIRPDEIVSPRDPAALDQFISNLGNGRLLAEPGAETFVATLGGETRGLVSVHPDRSYFTGNPRAFVDILVVAQEAEGRELDERQGYRPDHIRMAKPLD